MDPINPVITPLLPSANPCISLVPSPQALTPFPNRAS